VRIAVAADSDSIAAVMGYNGTSTLVVWAVDYTAGEVAVGTMVGTLEEESMMWVGQISDAASVAVTKQEHSILEDTVGTEERIDM
jgi:hypothetical protein